MDKGILSLVNSMNRTGWITTVSSCEGHGEFFPYHPYVAFFAKATMISKLAKILNQCAIRIEECQEYLGVELVCILVYDEEVANCQTDAPDGWVAFNLAVRPYDEGYTSYNKKLVLNILTEEFANN
jgi:hypothetical protein